MKDNYIVNSNDTLDKKYYLSLLYDFYGELLKDHHKQIFEDYVLNDLSLSEIADYQEISRQGVHDIIKRTSKQLEGFEEKLHLMEKYSKIRDKIRIADDLINNTSSEIMNKDNLQSIKNIFEDILNMI